MSKEYRDIMIKDITEQLEIIEKDFKASKVKWEKNTKYQVPGETSETIPDSDKTIDAVNQTKTPSCNGDDSNNSKITSQEGVNEREKKYKKFMKEATRMNADKQKKKTEEKPAEREGTNTKVVNKAKINEEAVTTITIKKTLSRYQKSHPSRWCESMWRRP